jgi:hypothetical protein
MKIYTPFTWRHVSEPNLGPEEVKAVEARISAVLDGWVGTRYQPGQQLKGIAADCLGFVGGVLDELFYRPQTLRENLPQDTAFHARESAMDAMWKLLMMYSPVTKVERAGPRWLIEPGDVIVTGPEHGGPGHALIVGGRPSELWHANNRRVQKGGLGLMERHQSIFGVFRLKRSRWL